ncbi:hypothetical protein D9M71_167660 [compost metagenome]
MERVAGHGQLQPMFHGGGSIVVVAAHPLMLLEPYRFQSLKLQFAGGHRVDQELKFGQLIEIRLVVERHLDILGGAELACRQFQRAQPERVENPLDRQRAPLIKAVRHLGKCLDGKLLEPCRVTLLQGGRRRCQHLGECLTFGNRLGIGIGQCKNDFGIVLRTEVVHFPHGIGYRQNAGLGAGQHVVDVADLQPFKAHAFRHRRKPAAKQFGARQCIEGRKIVAHIRQHSVLCLIAGMILDAFFVTAQIINLVGLRQVHHGVAMTHAVVRIGLKKCGCLGQGPLQNKVVIGGKGHIRRCHTLHAIVELGLKPCIGKLRQMPVVHIGKACGNGVVRLVRGVQHHNRT